MTMPIPNLRGIPDNAEPIPDSDPEIVAMTKVDSQPVTPSAPVTVIDRMEVNEPAATERVDCGTYHWTQNGKLFQGEFFVMVPPSDGSPTCQEIREDTYNRDSLIQDETLRYHGATDVTYSERPDCPIF